MGTNYYLIYNECKHCNRKDSVHLGKSSAGWKFTFQTIEDFPLHDIDYALKIAEEEEYINIESWRDLENFLFKYVVEFKTARIENEYDESVTLFEFVEMINTKHNTVGNKSHYSEVTRDRTFDDKELIDSEGHSFSRRDFS